MSLDHIVILRMRGICSRDQPQLLYCAIDAIHLKYLIINASLTEERILRIDQSKNI